MQTLHGQDQTGAPQTRRQLNEELDQARGWQICAGMNLRSAEEQGRPPEEIARLRDKKAAADSNYRRLEGIRRDWPQILRERRQAGLR